MDNKKSKKAEIIETILLNLLRLLYFPGES